MTGDHPTDWPTRHVKAQALREAAAELRTGITALRAGWVADAAATWLDLRAAEIEQP
jgi:hypothetical protein